MDTDRYCDWLVVFTAFMCHCMTHGIVYSYGILFVSLRDAFHGSKSELGWIVSLTTGCLYLSGPLASVLVNRFGNRTVATVGAVISSFAYILTIFSTSLYFMYFSLGFLSGVGYGLIFIPCVVDVTKRFQKYRALACGTAVSGAGFGAFVVSPLIKVLLDAYSWRGTLLIQAAILLNVIPCAMSFTGRSTVSTNINKMTSKHSEKGEYKKVTTEFADIEPDENDKSKIDTHSCKVINADVDGSTEVNDRYNIQTYRKYNEDNDGVINSDKCIYNTIATDTGSLKSYADENCGITQMSDLNAQTGFKNSTSSINKEIPKDFNNSVIEDKSKIDIEIECAHLQSEEINPAAKTLLHSSSIEMSSGKNLLSKFCSSLKFFGLLKRKEMLLFYTSQVLFISGLYLPFVFIPEMAISVGISRQSTAWIISTIGISTVFGRITLGYLSDRKFMNRVWLYKIALLVAGIITAVVPVLKTFHVLVVCAVIFGLSTAVLLSQTSVVLVEIVGMETMSDAMGLNNMFSGFGALLGPPFLGLLFDKTGNYLVPFLVAGLGMVLGSVLQCLMSLVPHHTPI